MRCDCCPLSNPEDTCPEAEGEYGIEHKDGVCGCRHPWNWTYKREMIYADALCEMGLDMGIEMSFTPDELRTVIRVCKDIVGIAYAAPYKRKEKLYYKVYNRTYLTTQKHRYDLLDKLPDYIIQKTASGRAHTYKLTKTGLAWLGRQVGATIHEIE